MALDRILIMGPSGAGKSTLAAQLAAKLGAEHIELDGLFWQANWVMSEPTDFRQRVDGAAPAEGRWVTDGNYRVLSDILWPRAQTVIWLDYALWRMFWRLLRRTWTRWWYDVPLWAGNRERPATVLAIFSLDSVFLNAYRSHYLLRERVPALSKEYPQVKVWRFRHPDDLQKWLNSD